MAWARRSRGNVVLIRAIAAGPVAAPSPAPSTRKRISAPAVGATADNAAKTALPAMPMRKMRR